MKALKKHPVGEVRPSQLLLSYGVGALMDLPHISALIMGLDDWDITNSREISEERLLSAVQRALGGQVARLYMPPIPPISPASPQNPFDSLARIGVPVSPFPRWMLCPACRLLAPLELGYFELKTNPFQPDRARYLHQNCNKMRQPPVLPSRFMIACEGGHLDDFPYHEFVLVERLREVRALTGFTRSAYTTRLVTATDEWSVRTLISGIAPQSKDGTVTYTMQYGFLTDTIQRNWSSNGNRPEEWSSLRRKMVTTQSAIQRGTTQTFRGQWLVIDEFNRAPIDVAFGDALTAIGGNEVLRVSIEGGSAELPIPQDFRIIGTLNSFDRSYLNQISEALKRRFSFIEILPPTRQQRRAEQGMVLYKALRGVSHLSNAIEVNEDGTVYWENTAMVSADENGTYLVEWDTELHPFREAFEGAWRLFEVIRIYRQLGTAQAISLFRHMLISGILQGYATREAWIEQALDAALCDTIADQLQVLIPDEIEVLLSYLTTDRAAFAEKHHGMLRQFASSRIDAQLLALGSVGNASGQPSLSDEQIEQIAAMDTPEVPAPTLRDLFHLGAPLERLPQFTRRLRIFKAERGL
jgi:AAA domain (dynein-related subfamily)